MVGLLAVLVLPVLLVVARTDLLTLLQAAGGAATVGALLSIVAVALARRGRQRIQRTLGRSGGERAARVGRALGVLGLCVAVTAALALGFFGLLTLFAD